MDIHAYRLREVLDLLNPVVPKKSSFESVKSVLFKDGKAIATDLETMVITEVPEIDITTLIPVQEVYKTLKYIPGGEIMNITTKDDMLSMSWEDGKISCKTQPADLFPEMPEFNSVAEASVNVDLLIPAMSDVLPYAAADTARPVLTGVTLILGDTIKAAAGDGYRIAFKELSISFPASPDAFTLILQPESVKILRHLQDKTPRTPAPSETLVPILLSKKYAQLAYDGEKALRFRFDKGTTAIVKLIQGNPPDFVKLFPKKKPISKALFLAEELLLNIHRLETVAMKDKGRIFLSFNKDSSVVYATGTDEEVESRVKPLSYEGEPILTGVNIEYLKSYLYRKQGIVSIEFQNPDSPICFQHQDDPKVLIMPMYVKKG